MEWKRETVEERQAARREMAAAENAKVEAARQSLGPAKAYGVWALVDHLGIEPTREVYCCRREGLVGWHPSAEEAFGDLLGVRQSDDEPVVVKGVEFHRFRYMLCWGSREEYHPMAPEALAKRNATLKANKAHKALAKEQAAYPLLAAAGMIE